MLELKAKMSMDMSNFNNNMKLSQREVKAWADNIKIHGKMYQEEADKFSSKWGKAFGVVAAVATGLGIKIAESFKFSKDIENTATRMGVARETVQSWKIDAEESGVALDSIAGMWEKVAEAMAKANEEGAGAQEFIDALTALGVTSEQIKSNDLPGVFKSISEYVKSADVDPNLITNLRKVGGRGAGSAIPFFKSDASKSGNILFEQSIARQSAAEDEIGWIGRRLNAQVRGIVGGAGAWAMNFITNGRVYRDAEEKMKRNKSITSAEAGANIIESQAEKRAREKEEAAREKAAQKIADANDKANQQRFNMRLSAEEDPQKKVEMLTAKYEELKKIANSVWPSNGVMPSADQIVAATEAGVQADELQAQIRSIKKQQNKGYDQSIGRLFPSDSLLSIGNFAGMGANPWARSETIWKSMENKLGKIETNTKPGSAIQVRP